MSRIEDVAYGARFRVQTVPIKHPAGGIMGLVGGHLARGQRTAYKNRSFKSFYCRIPYH